MSHVTQLIESCHTSDCAGAAASYTNRYTFSKVTSLLNSPCRITKERKDERKNHNLTFEEILPAHTWLRHGATPTAHTPTHTHTHTHTHTEQCPAIYAGKVPPNSPTILNCQRNRRDRVRRGGVLGLGTVHMGPGRHRRARSRRARSRRVRSRLGCISHPTRRSGVLQCVAVCCSVLQCAAVCCSVLQCVAVCCSVLQCVANNRAPNKTKVIRCECQQGGRVGCIRSRDCVI